MSAAAILSQYDANMPAMSVNAVMKAPANSSEVSS
jgi:hypothetical protein